MRGGAASRRALILAPRGRDSTIAEQLLRTADVAAQPVANTAELLREMDEGAGFAIVVEEAFLDVDLSALKTWVERQPEWSDFAFIVLTLRSANAEDPFAAVLTSSLGNVSFIERPFRPATLVSLARSAMRGRIRQYEARARLEELARGQEQLRFAQEAGRIGTFELDADTREVSVSGAFCRIWGLPERPAFSLAELLSHVEPGDRANVRTSDLDLRDDALNYIEYRVKRSDTGEIRWIARQGESLREPATGRTRFFGVVYDITERRRAEEAVRDSERRFRLIADSAPVPMWVTRLDRKRDFVNRAYAEFIGASYVEALDFDWRHIIHPDDIERIFKEQVEKEASLKPFYLEARYRNSTRAWRWLRSESQPRFDASGQHLGFIGVAYDITASKDAAAEMRRMNDTLEGEVARRTELLRSQEAQLRTMFETSYQLQGLLSLDGRLLEANGRALSAMGSTLGEVRGQLFSETFWANTPDVARRVRHGIANVAAGGSFREELLVELASGQRAFDLAMRRMVGDNNEDAFIFFEALETTERRTAEEQLRQAQKIESIGQLTGGIAHDFNNLLTGITGSLDLIKRRMESGRTDGIERFMEAAITSAQRAAALTHRLLAFARRQPLAPKPTDVNVLIHGLEDLLHRTLGETVLLDTELAPDLRPAMSDANQLESALVNLAINARDAMPDGGRLTISTQDVRREASEDAAGEIVAAGDFIAIRVSDTGSGMPADVIAKAFDPFFTTKPLGQGTGLGLSMVYGFVKQSGGLVAIDSNVGKGTSITLFLPRAQGAIVADTQASDLPTPHGDGETVLLVEDDSSVRLLMTEVLEELGYRYLQAKDGRAAIPILESDERIDLLVTDVGLPHVNGRKLAEVARRVRPDLKVLFVTGYVEGAANRSFLEPGMELVTKPFAMEDLGRRIRKLIAR